MGLQGDRFGVRRWKRGVMLNNAVPVGRTPHGHGRTTGGAREGSYHGSYPPYMRIRYARRGS